MQQIKIFSSESFATIEEKVNDFLTEHRNIIDISYQFHPVISKYDKNGAPSKVKTINRVMVLYDDAHKWEVEKCQAVGTVFRR